MRVLRRRPGPVAAVRPAEPYVVRAAGEARRRAHAVVGTEHVLVILVADPSGPAAQLLGRLGIDAQAVRDALAGDLRDAPGSLDALALASLGIDLDAVRERLEQTFGEGALETTAAGCLGIAPELKRALAAAVEEAGDAPLADEHVLLGLLAVSDAPAARALRGLGATLEAARAAMCAGR